MYVLMLVPSNFPNGDAGAVRDLSFSKIYQELGYDVVLIGMGQTKSHGKYGGTTYYSLYKDRRTAWDHFDYYFGYKRKCRSLIGKIIKRKGNPDVIHINDISHAMIKWLISFGEAEDIPIIHDSTEWYSPCEFKKGKWDKSYILKDRLNRSIIKNPVRVIAISEYLRRHFEKRGMRTIRIPVIMDVKNIKAETLKAGLNNSARDKVRFIYAGSPAAKDHLREIIEAVCGLSAEMQEGIELHILGVDDGGLLELAHADHIPACVKAYGRVPREQVLATMKSMDFSLLLRPADERYAKAGFPTKSVEAMSHGVAMMCNLTSDLGMYLKDGVNAVIVQDCTTEAVSASLIRIINMSRCDIDRLKENARAVSERSFDYREYTGSVKELIGNR